MKNRKNRKVFRQVLTIIFATIITFSQMMVISAEEILDNNLVESVSSTEETVDSENSTEETVDSESSTEESVGIEGSTEETTDIEGSTEETANIENLTEKPADMKTSTKVLAKKKDSMILLTSDENNVESNSEKKVLNATGEELSEEDAQKVKDLLESIESTEGFVVYSNELNKTNHIEGNIAVNEISSGGVNIVLGGVDEKEKDQL